MSTDTLTDNTTAGATEFAHMLLKVSDIKRSERFYVDLLGFKIRPAKPLPDGRPFVPFTQGLALTNGGPQQLQIDHMAFKDRHVPAIAGLPKAAGAKSDPVLPDASYGSGIY